MTLPVVAAVAVGVALLALAPLLVFCRVSRWKQDEAKGHVEELEAERLVSPYPPTHEEAARQLHWTGKSGRSAGLRQYDVPGDAA